MYKLHVNGRFVQAFNSRDDALTFVVDNNLISQEFEILDKSDV
jgi:hypothetical protein